MIQNGCHEALVFEHQSVVAFGQIAFVKWLQKWHKFWNIGDKASVALASFVWCLALMIYFLATHFGQFVIVK